VFYDKDSAAEALVVIRKNEWKKSD
jgi:hypothetical protein